MVRPGSVTWDNSGAPVLPIVLRLGQKLYPTCTELAAGSFQCRKELWMYINRRFYIRKLCDPWQLCKGCCCYCYDTESPGREFEDFITAKYVQVCIAYAQALHRKELRGGGERNTNVWISSGDAFNIQANGRWVSGRFGGKHIYTVEIGLLHKRRRAQVSEAWWFELSAIFFCRHRKERSQFGLHIALRRVVRVCRI